jgi:hypothetical protein
MNCAAPLGVHVPVHIMGVSGVESDVTLGFVWLLPCDAVCR